MLGYLNLGAQISYTRHLGNTAMEFPTKKSALSEENAHPMYGNICKPQEQINSPQNQHFPT